MKGQELKILFKHGKAYLTSHKAMTLEQLNLPPVAKNFESSAYWTIKVINYIEDEKKIFCEILSYHNGETHFEYNQIELAEKLNELQLITFRSINTIRLLRTLARKKLVLSCLRMLSQAIQHKNFINLSQL